MRQSRYCWDPRASGDLQTDQRRFSFDHLGNGTGTKLTTAAIEGLISTAILWCCPSKQPMRRICQAGLQTKANFKGICGSSSGLAHQLAQCSEQQQQHLRKIGSRCPIQRLPGDYCSYCSAIWARAAPVDLRHIRDLEEMTHRVRAALWPAPDRADIAQRNHSQPLFGPRASGSLFGCRREATTLSVPLRLHLRFMCRPTGCCSLL